MSFACAGLALCRVLGRRPHQRSVHNTAAQCSHAVSVAVTDAVDDLLDDQIGHDVEDGECDGDDVPIGDLHVVGVGVDVPVSVSVGVNVSISVNFTNSDTDAKVHSSCVFNKRNLVSGRHVIFLQWCQLHSDTNSDHDADPHVHSNSLHIAVAIAVAVPQSHIQPINHSLADVVCVRVAESTVPTRRDCLPQQPPGIHATRRHLCHGQTRSRRGSAVHW